LSDSLTLLLQGFQQALTLPNLVSAVIGCLAGTIVGILPGIGPAATISLMIPIVFDANPTSSLIMMTAVYLGAMYGGTITSVLLKLPGEAASVITCIDGFEMAKQGRAAQALSVAAIGSFVGGTLSVVALSVVALPVAALALKIGPAEFFSLLVAAMLFISVLLGGDLLRAVASVVLGLAISAIGTDLQTGVPRLTFGFWTLQDGIDLVVLVVGIFGVGEVIWFLSRHDGTSGKRLGLSGSLWLSGEDWRRSWPAITRGSVIGFGAGLLPGAGSLLGSVLSYAAEQRVSKQPEEFGKGAIEGVAGPETANNSATGAAMIPMLTLGIPASGATAVLLVALMMWGLQPGPRLMIDHPDVVWTVIASLYVSNVVLVILNLPLIPLFVRVLDIPSHFLLPLVLVIAVVGAYSLSESPTDVMLVLVFGGLGYLLRLLDIPQVGLLIGLVMGSSMEQSLRQAILVSRGDWSVFLTKPISAGFLALGLAVVLWDAFSKARKRKALT